jgi:hypothetical protein
MDTGKVELNQTSLTRSTPLTFGESMVIMFKFSKQVSWWFILAILPRTFFMIITVAFSPMAVKGFLDGVASKDTEMATRAFIFLIILSALQPVMTFLANALGMVIFVCLGDFVL